MFAILRAVHPAIRTTPPGQSPARLRTTARSSTVRALGALVGTALTVATLGGCSGEGGPALPDPGPDAGTCESPRREAIDPQSVLHVLPGAPEPPYDTDPPSSGPHVMGPDVEGVVDDPLERPVQVGVLERGGVVVQHQGLGPEGLASVAALAELGDVVVAPGTDLDTTVVATAWGARLRCDGVDVAALTAFVDDRLRPGSAMATPSGATSSGG